MPANIYPVNPLTQGVSSSNGYPLILFFICSHNSLGLYVGMNVAHPVPIPSAPFTNAIGSIGVNQAGSTVTPSSSI